jgi:hypothetical protein
LSSSNRELKLIEAVPLDAARHDVRVCGSLQITAHAEDAAGNVEKRPHVVSWTP